MDAGMGTVKGKNPRSNVQGLTSDPLYTQSTVTMEEQLSLVDHQQQQQPQQQQPQTPQYRQQQQQQQQQQQMYQPQQGYPGPQNQQQQPFYQVQQPRYNQAQYNPARGNTMPHYNESPVAIKAGHKSKHTFGNIFKRKNSSRAMDDFDNDKDEDTVMSSDESHFVSFKEISGFRGSGGPAYGTQNSNRDTAPIIPTVMSNVSADVSKLNNTEYRKLLTTQKKMAMSNYAKLQQQQQAGGTNMPPRAMSMQQMPPRAMSMQAIPGQMNAPRGNPQGTPQFHQTGFRNSPQAPTAQYSRASSMMGNGNPLNSPQSRQPMKSANEPPRAMSMQARPILNNPHAQQPQMPNLPALQQQQQQLRNGPMPRQMIPNGNLRANSLQSRPGFASNNASFLQKKDETRNTPVQDFSQRNVENSNPFKQPGNVSQQSVEPQEEEITEEKGSAAIPTSSPTKQSAFRKSASSTMLNKFVDSEYTNDARKSIIQPPISNQIKIDPEVAENDFQTKPSMEIPPSHQKSLSANLRPQSDLFSGLGDGNGKIGTLKSGDEDNTAGKSEGKDQTHKHTQSKTLSMFTMDSTESPSKPTSNQKKMYGIANNTTDMNLYVTANDLPEQILKSENGADNTDMLDLSMQTILPTEDHEEMPVDNLNTTLEDAEEKNISTAQNSSFDTANANSQVNDHSREEPRTSSTQDVFLAEKDTSSSSIAQATLQKTRTSSVSSLALSNRSANTVTSKSTLNKAKNFFRKLSSSKKKNSSDEVNDQKIMPMPPTPSIPDNTAPVLEQKATSPKISPAKFKFKPVNAAPVTKNIPVIPQNGVAAEPVVDKEIQFNPNSVAGKLWSQPPNAIGGEESLLEEHKRKSFHSLYSTPSDENKFDNDGRGTRESPVSVYSHTENEIDVSEQARHFSFENEEFDFAETGHRGEEQEPRGSDPAMANTRTLSRDTLEQNETTKVKSNNHIVPLENPQPSYRALAGTNNQSGATDFDTQTNGSAQTRGPVGSSEPTSTGSTVLGDSKSEDVTNLYKPTFVSAESQKNMSPSIITMNDSHTGFKSFYIDTDQLGLLADNKRLMDELAIVSKEFTDSIAREVGLELQNSTSQTSETPFSPADANMEYYREVQQEMRKKTTRIVSLIQELNDERLKRFIAEEQVLLFEKGVQPSALQLTLEIEKLKHSLKEKDDEIEHLKQQASPN